MKKITTVVLGYGDRGGKYADYSLVCPDELEIIGVVDPLEHRRRIALEKYKFSPSMAFKGITDFLKADVKCDLVINATMDSLHYSTTMALLNAKYNVLLEKPITNNKEELFALESAAGKNGCALIVCHVLRYTSFYTEIKRLIESGAIGTITSMDLSENIDILHFIKAFVRGKWRSEEMCGSGLLLQKCCHDLDLICWLNDKAKPVAVSSFGHRKIFTENKAPSDSTEFCYNCPEKDVCIYNAYNTEINNDTIPFYTWENIHKPLDTITSEKKEEFLKHDVFGRCIYKTGMDIMDRQNLIVDFSNGSVATFTVSGHAPYLTRTIRIVGEKGVIEGDLSENKITVAVFKPEKFEYEKKEFVIDPESFDTDENNAVTGHYGGDYYIMKDVVQRLSGIKGSFSTATIEDSISSHLLVYAAEESRKTGKTVYLRKYYEN